jgi:hypothetical protein
VFFKYLFDNISTGTGGSSLGPGGKMFCAKNHTESQQQTTYTMWTFMLILQNKGLKLRLKAVDTLGKPQKKESG